MTVKIFAGPTATGSALQAFSGVAVTGGTWTVSPSALGANAQYTVEVTQTDGSGNSGSATSTFVIDTADPAVTLDAPATDTTTPTFSGTAGDNTNSTTTSADDTIVTIYVCSGTRSSCDASSASLVETLTATRSGTSYAVTPTGGQALDDSATYTVQATQSDGVREPRHEPDPRVLDHSLVAGRYRFRAP